MNHFSCRLNPDPPDSAADLRCIRSPFPCFTSCCCIDIRDDWFDYNLPLSCSPLTLYTTPNNLYLRACFVLCVSFCSSITDLAITVYVALTWNMINIGNVDSLYVETYSIQKGSKWELDHLRAGRIYRESQL